ncbi:head decoration protein [Breoghania sp.]|uniref:head decoration protein n=1 Tax=Breoghania sp. TaxID=2065378 RepID=UPI002AAB9F00|nr:head decoration protein [Breoghania sp.]
MSMPFYSISRAPDLSSLIKWEANPDYCREAMTVLAGNGGARKIPALSIVAKLSTVTLTTAAAAAGAGNTGDGTLTLSDPAVTTAAKEGIYTVTCTEPAADGGTFNVEGPDGKSVGTAKVGTAFAKQIKFTIADGATDFAAGDSFTVTVTADVIGSNAGKVVAWDPAGTDGSEVAYGFACNEATAPDGEDLVGGLVVLSRMALCFAGGIAWPDGVTPAQKSAVLEVLEERGVVVRTA